MFVSERERERRLCVEEGRLVGVRSWDVVVAHEPCENVEEAGAGESRGSLATHGRDGGGHGTAGDVHALAAWT